jgi:hypothetical protein
VQHLVVSSVKIVIMQNRMRNLPIVGGGKKRLLKKGEGFATA